MYKSKYRQKTTNYSTIGKQKLHKMWGWNGCVASKADPCRIRVSEVCHYKVNEGEVDASGSQLGQITSNSSPSMKLWSVNAFISR